MVSSRLEWWHMDTAQSVATPWTKRGAGFIFVFKAIPMPEGMSVLDSETNEPNREAVGELIPALMTSPPIFQLIFYKDDERIKINDLYKCVLRGYQDTSDNPDTNEKLGLVLDALRNMGTANKYMLSKAPADLPSIFSSLVGMFLDEGSLAVGSVVNTETHLCFLKLDMVPALFLPPETKLSEQDSKA